MTDPFDFDDLPTKGAKPPEPTRPEPKKPIWMRNWFEPFIVIGMLTLAFGLLYVWIGQGRSVREAHEFVLKDSSGNRRASLGIDDDNPSLVMYDNLGRRRLMLSVQIDGPHVMLYDADEQPRAILAVSENGGGLSVFNAQGRLLNSVP